MTDVGCSKHFINPVNVSGYQSISVTKYNPCFIKKMKRVCMKKRRTLKMNFGCFSVLLRVSHVTDNKTLGII